MKRTRQDKILDLINRYEIETQKELSERLNKAGYPVTQATISRDIRELSLTKVAGKHGKSIYASLDSQGGTPPVYTDRYARVLQDGMVSVEQADNLVVVKTVSGMAMAVAAALDALELPEIVGSIAGDDTILCAVKTAELVPSVIAKIKKNQ